MALAAQMPQTRVFTGATLATISFQNRKKKRPKMHSKMKFMFFVCFFFFEILLLCFLIFYELKSIKNIKNHYKMKINNAMRSNNRNIWSRRLAVQAIYSW